MIRILLVALLSFSLLSCTPAGSGGGGGGEAAKVGVKNKNPGKKGPIIVLGDSLAKSMGSENEWQKIDKCIFAQTGVVTENWGVEGETSEAALKRVNAVIDANPALVIISLGGNDVLMDMAGQKFSETDTLANLRSIYRDLTDAGILVAHMGLDFKTPGTERLPKIRLADEAEGALFLPDLMAGIWGDASLMADQIHPNGAGYEIMCQRILKGLEGYYP